MLWTDDKIIDKNNETKYNASYNSKVVPNGWEEESIDVIFFNK